MRVLIFLTLVFTFSLSEAKLKKEINKKPIVSKEAISKAVNQATTNTMKVKVEGMVCAFCAQGIKKKFGKRAEVVKTRVNLDDMEVTLTFKKGKSLDEKTVKEIIESSGFKFVKAMK